MTITSPMRLGFIVPPANPAVEPEMRALFAEDQIYHTARLPVFPDTTLYERNDLYIKAYPEAVKAFGSLKLGAISIAMTGSSYSLLPDGDLAMCRELSASVGVPVVTASYAILMVLRAMGVKRLAMVSPYPVELTAKARAYWEAAGIEIAQTHSISDEFRAYELTDADIVNAFGGVDTSRSADADAVLLSGTGANTLTSLLKLSDGTRLPLLSSNLCSAAALWAVSGREATPALEKLLPNVARLGGPEATYLQTEMAGLLA
ncbi:MAG: hypothetical protein WDA25_03300 [Paracoccaceae bacterium]